MLRKKEFSNTDARNGNWCNHCGTVQRFLKTLKELLCDSAISLLGIYQKQRNKHTNLKRYTHPNVHSSIVYNYQVMEATSIPLNRRVDKDAMYIDNETVTKKNEAFPFACGGY